MARYLVTGGAGFIGSHLTERLLADGHEVRVLDDFSTGRMSNIEAIRHAGPDRLTVLTADLRDGAAVAGAVEGVDGVFHLAALGSVPRSIAQPLDTHDVNATGTLVLLEACRGAGVRRVVFASSSSVYGALEALPKREDHPVRPISPYGLSKLVGEEYLRIYTELHGMETVALRYYNVFGPRQNPAGAYAAVIPIFISKLLAGDVPYVNGTGEHSRDFTYVANVVDANVLVMNAPWRDVSAGLFNVAAGGRVSLNELLAAIADVLQVPPRADYGPPRAGDILHSQADVSRIRAAVGYEAGVSFAEGIRRTVEYFRAMGDRA